MRHALLALCLAACGGSTPAPTPTPAPAPAPAPPEDDALAPFPYTTDQIRAASPAGRVLQYRVETPGEPTVIQVMRFVSADAQGTEIESSQRDEQGAAIGTATRARATWGELQQHAAFPLASTTIADGSAETPAGRFAAKVYTVRTADEVITFYFAVDLAGPPVLFHTERAGARVMTSTLIATVDTPATPAPIACKTDDDCWLDGLKPIARPASERGKKLVPCKDSSRLPLCKQNVCTVNAYKC